MVPPRLSELISGPFYNPGIYPRVARLPPARPFLVLLLFTVLCGAVLTAQWYLVRSGRLAEISDSEIRELPTLTVEGGTILALERGPEAYDAELFVLWLEIDTNLPSEDAVRELLEPSERRPIVHIGKDALVVYRADTMPRPLPWTELTRREGTVSISGEDVVPWLQGQLGRRALEGLALGSAILGFYQLLLVIVVTLVYRLLFFRGPDVPGIRPLVSAGALAALPPATLVTLIGLAGGSQFSMISAHLLAFGLNFLFMVSRLRLDRPDPVAVGVLVEEVEEPAPTPGALLAGIEESDLEAMREKGLVSEEDYAIARELLGPSVLHPEQDEEEPEPSED